MTMDNSVLALSPLFSGFTPDEISVFASLITEKTISAGMTVFLEGMPGESLFIIEKGTVRISKMLAEGDEKTLVVLGTDDFFGEMAILDGSPRSATARVIEDAKLLLLKKSDYESICDENPRVGLKFVKNIIKVFTTRIRESNQELREILIWASK
ncbi:MAG: hypothetical protein A2091_11855 [Desulfuromonadales bacterium GWD2_61_12]|nr:MAG: hypothetical protein A2005_07815 [Desulfuromonadales bacterium GWC2_61_20]OGR34739.1 MAG: hypothetical protein A2091_11855 [Desulfuromonadales bacterium GWD2_61_12]HAD04846.1 hypothetical protein [Desulfuromonas sp.]